MNPNEIQFRVYDKANKRWIYAEPFYGILPGVPDEYEDLDIRSENLSEVQRFVGISDKNEQDIFEGDIVKATAISEYQEDTGIYRVIFNTKDLQYQLCPSGYLHGLSPTWGGWESLEIIGNMCETPELYPLPTEA